MRAAIVEVQKAWQDERLWKLVESKVWLPGPTAEVMAGAEVARLLKQGDPIGNRYQLVSLGLSRAGVGVIPVRGRTNGDSTPCGDVRINWANINDHARMTNTVAHENTHLIGSGSGRNGCDGDGGRIGEFADGKYTEETVPWLVSYAFGDLVQCFIDHPGSDAGVEKCFGQRVNALDGSCRLYEECCLVPAGGKLPANVKAIRERSGLCATASCTSEATACPAPSEEDD